MIIQNAAVSMNSRRTYTRSAKLSMTQIRVRAFDENMAEARARSGAGELLDSGESALPYGNYTKGGNLLYDLTGFAGTGKSDKPTKMDDPAAANTEAKVNSDTADAAGASDVKKSASADGTLSLDDFSTRMKFSILRYILQLLFGQQYSRNTKDGLVGETLGDRANNFLNSCAFDVTTASYTYSEEEATSFSTTGTVQTADGRNLSFNMNIAMTRSFSASYDAVSVRQAILQDPLVIRTNEEAPADASISDQTFVFDIDGDGKEEEVQKLSAGFGFLALDQNNNGKIDNGLELFGARSGNGFADLAQYDSDGNGWIDEADDIFSKLRIMTVDAEGNQKLISLKEADVGAINLGSVPTEFTKTGDDGINILGALRRSGFFLHESTGAAGALQQVDLGITTHSLPPVKEEISA